MAIDTFRAAKAVGHYSGWRRTHLDMQKLIYFAHMFYVGRAGDVSKLLVMEDFEAWDFGPVLPSLYHKLRSFGANIVRDVFPDEAVFDDKNDKYQMIKETVEFFADKHTSRLVELTHLEGGGWAKHYEEKKNRVIPTEDILAEYNNFYK